MFHGAILKIKVPALDTAYNASDKKESLNAKSVSLFGPPCIMYTIKLFVST